MTQAAFAFAAELTPAPVAPAEWVTGQRPDISGVHVYVVLIRAPGDPERTPRELAQRDGTAEWRRELAKKPVPDIEEAIALHMADGAERTMNRITVEMLDKTADVVPDSFQEALWGLVSKSALEFTLTAPVLFRKTKEKA